MMAAIANCEWRIADWGSLRQRSSLLFVLGAIVVQANSIAVAQEGVASRNTADRTASVDISPNELALVRAAERARIAAIDKVYGAVVAIYGNDRAGGGSGVLVDPSGFAVTNHHVVAAAGVEGWAGLADGKLYRWKLVGTDPGGDLAVIRLEGKDAFPIAPLGDSNMVRVGDWSMAMGNPFTLAEDQRPTVTVGIVSGVNRYQPGEGMNQLVYGNCIQVDSSINPGNSGGPLFNLRGDIIGINGRGSFQERGRVNVGLGYAISSNQVKLFLPELLTTKIAQHGTLDAQFGNRKEGVVCHTLNLDSPAARAGLELGDCLFEFEGQKIVDANQFTSLLSIYPAGWPVTLTVGPPCVDGRCFPTKEIHVRLTPLPYEPLVKRSAAPKKKEPLPTDPDKREKPELPPMPVLVETPKLPLADAGKIRDWEQNRAIAQLLLERYRQQRADAVPLKEGGAISWREKQFVTNTTFNEHVLTVASDGRSHSKRTVAGRTTVVAFDGQKYWRQLPDQPAEEISPAKASRSPWFSQALAIVALRTGDPPKGFGSWRLDGSDKARGKLAYRLSTSDETGEQFFLWLGATEEEPTPGQAALFGRGLHRRVVVKPKPYLRLVKSGVGIDHDEPIPAVLYYYEPDSVCDIHPEMLVQGLGEEVQYAEERRPRGIVREIGELETVDDSLFQMPAKDE